MQCSCTRIDPDGHVITGFRFPARLSTTQATRRAITTTAAMIHFIRNTLAPAAASGADRTAGPASRPPAAPRKPGRASPPATCAYPFALPVAVPAGQRARPPASSRVSRFQLVSEVTHGNHDAARQRLPQHPGARSLRALQRPGAINAYACDLRGSLARPGSAQPQDIQDRCRKTSRTV
jgi:hypothetical protein